MSSPIDVILSRLEPFRVRENGRDRWRSCCPAHGGKNPSALSIGLGQDGQVLLRCWHGCEIDAVVGALGLELQDLFPPRPANGHGAGPIRRRRLLTAGQALNLLDQEAHFLIVVASDLYNGQDIGDEARERLLLSAARISAMQSEVRA